MQFLEDINSGKKIKLLWQECKKFCEDIESVDDSLLLSSLEKLLVVLKKNHSTRQFQSALEKLAKNDQKRGENLYNNILKTKSSNSLPLLASLLVGIYSSCTESAIRKIRDLVDSDEENLKVIGLESIAKIDLSKDKAPKEFIKWIDNKLLVYAKKNNKEKLLVSTFIVARVQRKQLDKAEEAIDILSSKTQTLIKAELFSYLAYNLDLDTEIDLVEKHIYKLLNIELEYKGLYSQLSHFLESLVAKNINLVVDFLTQWILQNIEIARKIQLFAYVINTIYDEHYVEFQKVFTQWLNRDEPNFHIAIFEMNRVGEIRDIGHLELCEKLIQSYTIYDIEYITFKILAYVYDKDTSLNIVYSILRVKYEDKELSRFLSDVFIDYFIFNYYSAIDFLEEKAKSAPAKLKKIIKTIISEGQKSYASHSDLKILKEFHPSEKRLNHFNKIRSKKFQKSFKETNNDRNSFLSMAKNLYFRTGKSSFAKFRGEYSKEMTPALISHSGELPRGEFIDPVGQAKLRLQWQNFKRNK